MSARFSEDVHFKETVSVSDILDLLENCSPFDLFNRSLQIKKKFSHDIVDLCSIINAKSGSCQEDCSYCAQSSISKADVRIYPLLDEETIIAKAKEAQDNNVKRFCIVTSGRAVSKNDLKKISKMVRRVRDLGLLPCATLGLLDRDDLALLNDSGLERFHHNLETSERYFPSICSTHSYADKLRTIEAVKRSGLSLCSGGIFGMGESWRDRIDMAFTLRDIGADSIPINYLTPIDGTPLAGMDMLNPIEALTIISIYRIIMPERQIRICGGRMQTLGELAPLVFLAGADGLLTGDYLTTTGRGYSDDIDTITKLGFRID